MTKPSATPMLDKAREEELTTYEVRYALLELKALDDGFAYRFALHCDGSDWWITEVPHTKGREYDSAEAALCAKRDEIEEALARDEDPGTDLAVKHGCTCTAPTARSTDIDPPEVRRDRDCPLHGGEA